MDITNYGEHENALPNEQLTLLSSVAFVENTDTLDLNEPLLSNDLTESLVGFFDNVIKPVNVATVTEEVPASQPAVSAVRSTTPVKPDTSINSIPSRLDNRKYRMVDALVTAYCPCRKCCGRGSPGRTSRGTTAWVPGIAADPKAIRYGTEIFVPGYGLRKVDDTGGAMRQSWRRRGRLHLDIRMTYHWQARKWGRRYMKVRVYNKK